MSGLRRFIAGARCPACGQFDKLFLVVGEATRICECVACGFRDQLARDGSNTASVEAEAVRLIDPREHTED